MHWGGLVGLSGIAAVTVLVVSGPEVRRYPILETVARERLATTPLPEPLLDMAGHQVSLVREDGALVWHLGDAKRRSVARVTIEGDGASTNVTIDFNLADKALGDSPISKTRLTRSMAESIFAEHVDSVLGRRPFDAQRMMTGTAREIQANPEMLQEYGEAIDDQFNDVAKMLNGSMNVENMPVDQPIDGLAATRPTDGSFKPMTKSLEK